MLRLAAQIILTLTYGTGILVAILARAIPRRGWQPNGRIVVMGTFFNPNWYHSHVTPLARCGLREVILVCDKPADPMENVRFVCPPAILSAIASRAIAKFLWTMLAGIRYRPDLYMGYHIFPGALFTLVAARLFGRPACYQVTSGQLELEGGGWHAENRLLIALKKPSALIETMALALVRQFDLIVVRGNDAKNYVRNAGYRGSLAVITGSVKERAWQDWPDRDNDLVFVGRLTEYKRPDRFVATVAGVAKQIPRVCAVMVGDGPLMRELKDRAAALGVRENINFTGQRKDVETILSRSKIFVLTSRWEGLSIAMMEAMAAGAVPVVSDVGDLRDLVREGENGHLVGENQIDVFVEHISRLLGNPLLWRRCSLAAARDAIEFSGIEAICARWRQSLAEAIGNAGRLEHSK
jgi:glycosyltransferase involved in cell wall biosynthesis